MMQLLPFPLAGRAGGFFWERYIRKHIEKVYAFQRVTSWPYNRNQCNRVAEPDVL